MWSEWKACSEGQAVVVVNATPFQLKRATTEPGSQSHPQRRDDIATRQGAFRAGLEIRCRSISEEAGTLRPQLPAERAQRGVRRERRIRNRRKGRTETEHEIGPLFSTTKADRILLVEVRLGWTPPGATFQTQWVKLAPSNSSRKPSFFTCCSVNHCSPSKAAIAVKPIFGLTKTQSLFSTSMSIASSPRIQQPCGTAAMGYSCRVEVG